MQRRAFIHSVSLLTPQAWAGANDRIRVALIGAGGRCRYGIRDLGQTPNEQTATFVRGDGKQIVFESRDLSPRMPPSVFSNGSRATVELDLDGNLRIPGLGKHPERVTQPDSDGLERDHHPNFIDAIRAAKPDALNRGIEEAGRSTTLAHPANISCRLRSEMRFEAASRKFVSHREADAPLGRTDREPFALSRKV